MPMPLATPSDAVPYSWGPAHDGAIDFRQIVTQQPCRDRARQRPLRLGISRDRGAYDAGGLAANNVAINAGIAGRAAQGSRLR
jgi:hypothetical protein